MQEVFTKHQLLEMCQERIEWLSDLTDVPASQPAKLTGYGSDTAIYQMAKDFSTWKSDRAIDKYSKREYVWFIRTMDEVRATILAG